MPPPGAVDLSMFPQHLLMSNPNTAGWHSLGMEWKEYVAWFAPISITMVMVVFVKYGQDLKNHRQLRNAVLGFAAASFIAAGIAGFFGAMINKNAPVYGGKTIQFRQQGKRVSAARTSARPPDREMTNGSGAAAILSAGVGCFVLAILALAGDKSAVGEELVEYLQTDGAAFGSNHGCHSDMALPVGVSRMALAEEDSRR